jgi:parallel beta-helix repeat protein
MIRIASILAMVGLLLVSCENGQDQSVTQSSPINPQIATEGEEEGIINLRVSFAPWKRQAAKLTEIQVINKATAYVYNASGAEVTHEDLTLLEDRASGRITVPAQESLRVALVYFDGSIVRYIGEDEDVDVPVSGEVVAEIVAEYMGTSIVTPDRVEVGEDYTVSWMGRPFATGYELQEATAANFSGAVTHTGTDTFRVVSGKSEVGTTFYYRARVNTEYGYGPWHSTGSASTGTYATDGVIIVDVPIPPDEPDSTQDPHSGQKPPIIVDVNGEGDRLRIQQAINISETGDKILIRPGVYNEKIIIDKVIKIFGIDPRECQIIYSGEGDAVTFTNTSENAQIFRLSITSLGGSGIICRSGSSPVVKNNIISGNTGNGIIVNSNAFPVVINNTIIENRDAGIFYNSDYMDYLDGTLVSGNVINNIIILNDSGIIWYWPSSSPYWRRFPPEFSYNNVWGNTQRDYLNSNSSSITYSPSKGSISEDPEFVDMTGGDFRFKPSSLSIDAGWDGPTYADPDGTRNDMGAYGGPDAPNISTIGQ